MAGLVSLPVQGIDDACPPPYFVNAAAAQFTTKCFQARATRVRGPPIKLGFSLGGWGLAKGAGAPWKLEFTQVVLSSRGAARSVAMCRGDPRQSGSGWRPGLEHKSWSRRSKRGGVAKP